jgi:hypothetical protein
MEGGVERSLFHPEQLTRDSLNVKNDAVTVEGGVLRESFEYEELKCSLQVVFSHSVLCLEF